MITDGQSAGSRPASLGERSAWPIRRVAACRQQAKPDRRHDSERRDRPTGSAWGEHQFKQRDRVADAVAHRSEWAISPVRDDEHALTDQGRDRRAQQRPVTTTEHTPPHVSDRGQKAGGDHGVRRSPRNHRRRQACIRPGSRNAPHGSTVRSAASNHKEMAWPTTAFNERTGLNPVSSCPVAVSGI